MSTCVKCGGTRFNSAGKCHTCKMAWQRASREKEKVRKAQIAAENPVPPKEKKCRRCGGTDFNQSGGCRPCKYAKSVAPERKAAKKEYRDRTKEAQKVRHAEWYQTNKAAQLVKYAEYRKKHAEEIKLAYRKYYESNKEAYVKRAEIWWKANPVKAAKIRSAMYVRNADKINEANKKWKLENRNVVAEMGRRRRARKKSGEADRLPSDIEQRLYRFQGGKCACCGTGLEGVYHLDHIIPLSKGGGHTIGNVQLLAPMCNLQKSARDPIQFMLVFRPEYAATWARNIRGWRDAVLTETPMSDTTAP